MSTSAIPVLTVEGLKKTFGKTVTAVNGVSFELFRGETLGIVGESGCGKSTTARMILALEKPDAGSVRIGETDIHTVGSAERRRLRRRIQLVPQNPQASFNPGMTIGASLRFALAAQGFDRKGRQQRVKELMNAVGLPVHHENLYPHQLSGGQLQRAAIARALGPRPEIIVCDEAVSALDKSVQAQVLNLLVKVQKETGVSLIFVSHDLAVVEHMSDRLLVMYRGEVVETGNSQAVYRAPTHPYTKTLLESVLNRRG